MLRQVIALTNELADGPQLTGTLVLRNAVEDRAVRVVGGALAYRDATGARIATAPERDGTTFTFPSYSVERLDLTMKCSAKPNRARRRSDATLG